MKTTQPCNSPRLFGVLAALSLSFLPALRADPAPAGAEPKDHTLFMGLNLEIQDGVPGDTGYYRILDRSGDSAVIRVNGQLREVPFIDIKQYQLKLEPKVAGLPVSVEHFVSDRVYTPANDPRKIWSKRQNAVSGYMYDQESNLTTNISLNAMLNSGKQMSGPGPNAVAVPNTGAAAGINRDTAALNNYVNGESGDMGDASFYDRKMQEDLDKKLFDAVDVTFEVSSPVELNAPYAVLVTEFREKEDSKEAQRWILIKPLQPIYTQPIKVHVMQAGLPPGFAMGTCQVHLYNAGHEVPTTASAKRMSLTKTQVLEYADIQYLLDHKGQTLQPAPMHDSAPARLRDDVDAAQLNQTFKVTVSKQGQVVDVSTSDQAGNSHYTQEIWKKLRFYPALDSGKPVAATIDARLADFAD